MSLKADLRSLQEGGDPEIHERVDLRAWTVLGVGGPADLLIRCRSADGLCRALDLLATRGLRWLVIGSGSRLVPPDGGLRVPVLNLSGTLNLWQLDVEGAVAGGGAIMAQVCRAAARNGLPAAVPTAAASGTVGGAVAAAAAGFARLADLLEWVETARPGAEIERIQRPLEAGAAGGAVLDLDRRVLVRARLRLAAPRRDPGSPGGSRRPERPVPRPPRSAWPLFVDGASDAAAAQLTPIVGAGCTVGGANLSGDDPNRVTTTRSARAADVLELVRTVLSQVAPSEGSALRSTLRFVDEHGEGIEP